MDFVPVEHDNPKFGRQRTVDRRFVEDIEIEPPAYVQVRRRD